MSWAFGLPDSGIDLAALPHLAADLEAAGSSGLWVGEVSGTDAATNLTMIGTGTRRIPLGTSIVLGYAEQQRGLERGPQLEAMWQAWAARERKAALERLPDEVIDQLVIHGSPATCRERLRDFAIQSGALPIAHVVPGGPPSENVARALGPVVDSKAA